MRKNRNRRQCTCGSNYVFLSQFLRLLPLLASFRNGWENTLAAALANKFQLLIV